MGKKDWQINELQRRLQASEVENAKLQRKLQAIESVALPLPEPATNEKRNFAIIAEQAGLPTGYYEGWQIGQAMDAVKDNRDLVWQLAFSDLMEFLSVTMTIERIMTDVSATVQVIFGDLVVTLNSEKHLPYTKEHAGFLMDMLTQWRILAEGINFDFEAAGDSAKNFERDVIGMASAIKSLVNGNDKGESMRIVAQRFQPLSPKMKSLVDLKRPGRNKGATSVTAFLGEWGDRLQGQGMEYSDIAETIIGKLEQKESLSSIEQKALDKLTSKPKYSESSTRADYLRGVVNRYRK